MKTGIKEVKDILESIELELNGGYISENALKIIEHEEKVRAMHKIDTDFDDDIEDGWEDDEPIDTDREEPDDE